MITKTKGGRKQGRKNRGYWYRKNRGWYTSDGQALRDELGLHIKDRRTPENVLRKAMAASLSAHRPQQVESTDALSVAEACRLFLDYSLANDSPATYELRAAALFDFCTGYPASLRTKPVAERRNKCRVHDGYGNKAVGDLIHGDVDRWFLAHPNWDGSKRTKFKSIERALNYCKGAGYISRNPLRGYNSGSKRLRANSRLTYITPEQETAIQTTANPALALAIKVCVRTGMRPGKEFAKLTAKHVEITDNGLVLRFSPRQQKTGKTTGRPRIIYVNKQARSERDNSPEIVAAILERMERHSSGPLFRNTTNTPWTYDSLKKAFQRLRRDLAKNGVELLDGACMYSCRHTYSKRTLSGFWTGQYCTIEHLAKLMGNSVIEARKYAEWCELYVEPLWEAC